MRATGDAAEFLLGCGVWRPRISLETVVGKSGHQSGHWSSPAMQDDGYSTQETANEVKVCLLIVTRINAIATLSEVV